MASKDTTKPGESLTQTEREALHEVELGLEWLQRAQGSLLEFHHATGHGMDHLETARRRLAASGHHELATAVQTEVLPRGVVDGDRWSYDVVESFQSELLVEVVRLEARVRRELADGKRHVTEREQERAWKARAEWER